MDWINYHHLYYFWIIAKEGSVTKAAKRLNLSQPTLSGQLRQFEDFVKKPVFERKARGLELNENGRMLFNYADSIFHLGQEMMAELHRPARGKTAVPLKIGIDEHLPKKIVHKYLRQAIAANFVVQTDGDVIERQVDKLLARNLDFILSAGKPAHLSPALCASELEHSHYVLAAAPEWKKLKKNFPASLQNQPVMVPALDGIKAGFENTLKIWNCQPSIIGIVDDPELLRICALASEAVIVIPKAAISDLVKRKELVILGEDLPMTLTVCLLTGEHKSQHIRDFLDNLQK